MSRRRALSDEQIRRARMLHSQGYGYKRIAKELGSNFSTIRDNLLYYTAYSARVA